MMRAIDSPLKGSEMTPGRQTWHVQDVEGAGMEFVDQRLGICGKNDY